MAKRIVFTGGSGKAGRHVVPWLQAKGYEILNLDLKPLDCPGVNTLITDVTDSGQVFNALSMHFGFDGYRFRQGPGQGRRRRAFRGDPARAARRPTMRPSAPTSSRTYNVIEAAVKLGIRKVVIASSETTYGVCFAEGDKDFHQFPLEEDYDIDPMDSYGLSKVVNEKTARAFAMRTGADIYALRIGNVIEPHEYDMFPKFLADPPSRKRNAWAYIDARDLGQIVHLCLEQGRAGLPGVQRRQRHHHRQRADREIPARNGARTRRSPARSASSRRRCPTARSARCSASAKSTIGGSMCSQISSKCSAAPA